MAATKAATHKNQDVSSPPKAGGETQPAQKGTKVPPPVAKKPKSKGKEMETSEGTEPTAGQEEQQESSMGKSLNNTHKMATLKAVTDVLQPWIHIQKC